MESKQDGILVNDKPCNWQLGMVISDVLAQMEFQFPQTVVSVNGCRIAPERYDSHEVPKGAIIKIVYICHGG